MSTVKNKALELILDLPDDVTLGDILHRLSMLEKRQPEITPDEAREAMKGIMRDFGPVMKRLADGDKGLGP